jgi:hypothetical protein
VCAERNKKKTDARRHPITKNIFIATNKTQNNDGAAETPPSQRQRRRICFPRFWLARKRCIIVKCDSNAAANDANATAAAAASIQQ